MIKPKCIFGDAIPEKVKGTRSLSPCARQAVKEMKAGNTTKAVWEKAEAARGPFCKSILWALEKHRFLFWDMALA